MEMIEVNYIKIMNSFWAWRKDHYLSHAQVDLYFGIVAFMNQSRWQNPVMISNAVLEEACGFSRNELHKARFALITAELIQYVSGKKGSPGIYTLVQLDVKNSDRVLSELTGEKVVALFVQCCPDMWPCEKTNDTLQQLVDDAFSRGETLDSLKIYFKKAAQTPFLNGVNERGWKASLAWLLSDQRMDQVRIGKFDHHEKRSQKTQQSSYDIDEFERFLMAQSSVSSLQND